jgi:hypothetical protein
MSLKYLKNLWHLWRTKQHGNLSKISLHAANIEHLTQGKILLLTTSKSGFSIASIVETQYAALWVQQYYSAFIHLTLYSDLCDISAVILFA